MLVEQSRLLYTLEGTALYLLGAALQHFFIVLAVGPAQVGSQPLRWLIGQFDAVLQQTDRQSPLQ